MESSSIQQFREKLDVFVFFHLGSDAAVRIEENDGGVTVSLRHERIQPFRFSLDLQRLTALLADPELFEETMLDYLVAHRRS